MDERMARWARDEKFREWSLAMPVIRFPQSWGITITPPFGGAAARFEVRKGAAYVSVYADFDGSLGYFDGPYWEVYPYEGDTYRCSIGATDELLAAITKSIRQQNRRTPAPAEEKKDE